MRRQSDVFFGERESGQDVRQTNGVFIIVVHHKSMPGWEAARGLPIPVMQVD